jgi:ABC-2 type transport system ATP-binding protein
VTAPAIRFDGLTRRFGRTEALKGISGEIMPGRLTGIVGPDGAGKTTLMRILAGLMDPTSGTLSVSGHDPVTQPEAVKQVIGYMPQRFGLYEDLSVLENLTLYADLRAVPVAQRPETFERMFAFTKLGPFTDRPAGKLSGGMKQKLGLACALLGTPRVLLLDEPGVGVDPVSRQDLWAMVQALTDGGMAVVWSTAYLDEAERCTDVLALNEGEILFAGMPADLTARLHGRSLRIRNPAADRREVLRRALSVDAVLDGVIQGESVRVVLESAKVPGALHALASETGGVLEPVPPRFEDGFIDLLGGGPGGESALADVMEPVQLESEVAVSCRALTKRFGDFTAAGDVSFEVRRGEVFGLLGPNGAGKSTTFKMLCGLLKPTAGAAEVVGRDLRRDTGAAKRQLGYMAQKFALYGLLNVRQNLEFAAGVYGLAGAARREKVDQMIAIFGLGPMLDASPDALPLGFKQRLALACALMHAPPVLFLDEPTSGVDPVTRREFWTHINGLARKGVTIMVTTHFMDEAEYCDRVALMYKSRLIALDTPDALKARTAALTGRGSDDVTIEDAFIGLIKAEDEAAEQRRQQEQSQGQEQGRAA